LDIEEKKYGQHDEEAKIDENVDMKTAATTTAQKPSNHHGQGVRAP
jgi:hypothetical protein